MDGPVSGGRDGRVRLRPSEVAYDRVSAARLHVGGLLAIPDERVHMVPGTNQRIENRRSDVAGAAREKDTHRFESPVPLIVELSLPRRLTTET